MAGRRLPTHHGPVTVGKSHSLLSVITGQSKRPLGQQVSLPLGCRLREFGRRPTCPRTPNRCRRLLGRFGGDLDATVDRAVGAFLVLELCRPDARRGKERRRNAEILDEVLANGFRTLL